MTVDKDLKLAITTFRDEMRNHLKSSGRAVTYFMFNTTQVSENFAVTQDGPRIGFNAETVARLLVLLQHWDAVNQDFQSLGLDGLGRLFPFVFSSEEVVFDEVSNGIYSAQIRIETRAGITIPMRDPNSGVQMRSNGGISAHEMFRTKIENWQKAEQVIFTG